MQGSAHQRSHTATRRVRRLSLWMLTCALAAAGGAPASASDVQRSSQGELLTPSGWGVELDDTDTLLIPSGWQALRACVNLAACTELLVPADWRPTPSIRPGL